MAQRFLTLADVAESLAVSVAQVRVLVRSGELPAIQVGGRNQWRVEISALEEYIQQQYARTRERIGAEPDGGVHGAEHDGGVHDGAVPHGPLPRGGGPDGDALTGGSPSARR